MKGQHLVITLVASCLLSFIPFATAGNGAAQLHAVGSSAKGSSTQPNQRDLKVLLPLAVPKYPSKYGPSKYGTKYPTRMPVGNPNCGCQPIPPAAPQPKSKPYSPTSTSGFLTIVFIACRCSIRVVVAKCRSGSNIFSCTDPTILSAIAALTEPCHDVMLQLTVAKKINGTVLSNETEFVTAFIDKSGRNLIIKPTTMQSGDSNLFLTREFPIGICKGSSNTFFVSPKAQNILPNFTDCGAGSSLLSSYCNETITFKTIQVEPLPTTARPTTVQPTKLPTRKPTIHPTARPTLKPTIRPTTTKPTRKPSVRPTTKPTQKPTKSPNTAKPTQNPTNSPTAKPTQRPTTTPTTSPTQTPSPPPTALPTQKPTNATNIKVATIPPTISPTQSTISPITPTPTTSPSTRPTKSPTHRPTKRPTKPRPKRPTKPPTEPPSTLLPSNAPTPSPTAPPTDSPTKLPSLYPTKLPSTQPISVPTQCFINVTISCQFKDLPDVDCEEINRNETLFSLLIELTGESCQLGLAVTYSIVNVGMNSVHVTDYRITNSVNLWTTVPDPLPSGSMVQYRNVTNIPICKDESSIGAVFVSRATANPFPFAEYQCEANARYEFLYFVPMRA